MLTLTPIRLAILAAGVIAVAGVAYWAGTQRRAAPAAAPAAPLELAGVAFSVTDFSALSGWAGHDPSPAVGAFARSCARRAAMDEGAPANPHEALSLDGVTLAGAAGDWRGACAAAGEFLAAPAGAAAARTFFESHFQPVALAARMAPAGDASVGTTIEPKGRFTAYF